MATTPSSFEESGAYVFHRDYIYDGGSGADRTAVGPDLASTPPSVRRRSKNWTEDGGVKDNLDIFCEDNDVPSAKKVVSGTNEMKGDSSDLFTKHEVPRISPQESTLSSALEATENEVNPDHITPDDSIRTRENTGTHSLSDLDNESYCTLSIGGNSDVENEDWAVCSVRHLITAILAQNRVSGVATQLLTGTADQHSLRIADEEEADPDYPVLDMDASVVNIGVNQFVVCPCGQSNALLVVNLDFQRNVPGKDGRCTNLEVDVTFWKPGAALSDLSRIVVSTSIASEGNANAGG